MDVIFDEHWSALPLTKVQLWRRQLWCPIEFPNCLKHSAEANSCPQIPIWCSSIRRVGFGTFRCGRLVRPQSTRPKGQVVQCRKPSMRCHRMRLSGLLKYRIVDMASNDKETTDDSLESSDFLRTQNRQKLERRSDGTIGTDYRNRNQRGNL